MSILFTKAFWLKAGRVARFWIWPRGGWVRAFHLIMRRMARMKSTPYALAIGFAAGTFISFTPLFGFHILLAGAITWALRGNIIAAALGTSFGNPLTFPLIWAGDYLVGHWILNRIWLDWNTIQLPGNFDEATRDFHLLLIGSLPLGLVVALLIYAPVYYVIVVYREEKAKPND